MLPLRATFPPSLPFVDLLKRVRHTALGAFDHQELPFDQIVEAVRPDRSHAQVPLFGIAFGFANTPGTGLSISGLDTSLLFSSSPEARCDLTAWYTESGRRLLGQWTVDTSVLNPASVDTLRESYDAILAHIAADPRLSVDRLAEREQDSRALEAGPEEDDSRARLLRTKPVTLRAAGRAS